MHISTLAAFATLALPLISAQLSSIPQCAQNVTESAITAAGCTDVDVHCFCTPTFMGSLQSQIARTCSVSDQQVTLGFAQQMCRSIGITFDLPAEMSASVATSTAVATSTSALAPGTTTVEDATATLETSWTWTSTPTPKSFAAVNGTNTTSWTSSNSTNSTLSANGTVMTPGAAPKFTGAGARSAAQWVASLVVGIVAVVCVL